MADATDAMVKPGGAKLDEAQTLHEAGKHAVSMLAARDANGMLGVK
jgi:hypothetical protein